jgi:hypothetical protein
MAGVVGCLEGAARVARLVGGLRLVDRGPEVGAAIQAVGVGPQPRPGEEMSLQEVAEDPLQEMVPAL